MSKKEIAAIALFVALMVGFTWSLIYLDPANAEIEGHRRYCKLGIASQKTMADTLRFASENICKAYLPEPTR